MEAFEAGIYSIDELKDRKDKADRNIRSIEREMSELKPPQYTPGMIVSLHECIDLLTDDSIAAQSKNDLLKSLIARIDYYNDTEPYVLPNKIHLIFFYAKHLSSMAVPVDEQRHPLARPRYVRVPRHLPLQPIPRQASRAQALAHQKLGLRVAALVTLHGLAHGLVRSGRRQQLGGRGQRWTRETDNQCGKRSVFAAEERR